MKRYFIYFICLFLFSSICAFPQNYRLSQVDINEFLAFANEYKELAVRYIKGAEQRSISEIFYSTDSEKWVGETDKFLKLKGWTFDKMNQFLYSVYLALLSINYEEMYGVSAADGGENLFDDVSQETKILVKKNRKALAVFFPEDDEYGSEADEDIEYTEEAEAEDEPPMINGEIRVEARADKDIQVNVVFDSGAQDLLMVVSIVRGDDTVLDEEPVRVKPWTVKGGHIDHTWKLEKAKLKKGKYTARVVISDLDGNRVGEQETEFTLK